VLRGTPRHRQQGGPPWASWRAHHQTQLLYECGRRAL